MVAITEPLNVKLMLVGSSSVGKTCVLLRFTDEDAYEHDSGTIATVGVDYRVRGLGQCIRISAPGV
jgi:Ras-related protein Rab-18